jgi:hypothetical protein
MALYSPSDATKSVTEQCRRNSPVRTSGGMGLAPCASITAAEAMDASVSAPNISSVEGSRIPPSRRGDDGDFNAIEFSCHAVKPSGGLFAELSRVHGRISFRGRQQHLLAYKARSIGKSGSTCS